METLRLKEVTKPAYFRKWGFYTGNSVHTNFNIHNIIIILYYSSIIILWDNNILYQNYTHVYDEIFFLE